MALILGEIFDVFKKYQITEKNVFAAYNEPDRVETLENNIRLYLKCFNSLDSKRRLLLLGTNLSHNEEYLALSYWVPQDYNSPEVDLIDILEVFANQFGLRIEVGDKEGYFIRNIERFIPGKFEDFSSIIKLLAPDQIPSMSFVSISEDLIGALNKVYVFYAFVINEGKYLFWVDSLPTIKLEVKSDYYDFIKNNLVDFLNPNGQTKIRMQKQMFTDELELDSNLEMLSIDAPEIYKDQFRHITKQINGLKKNEHIHFEISFGSPKCLFCQSNDLSKEHIFPKWLTPYLEENTFSGMQYLKIPEQSLYDAMEKPTTFGKKDSSHGYTTNIVCRTCNNTWMSKLENEVKLILMDKQSLICAIPKTITRQNANTLSIWLIVKSLLLSKRNSPNFFTIPKNILERLKNRELISGFLVESCIAKKSDFNFGLSHGLLDDNILKVKKIPLERARQMLSNFFSCSIQLNHLMFRISYLDPNLPFERITCVKKTLKLFPFKEPVRHDKMETLEGFWEKIALDGFELQIFSNLYLLVEKNLTRKR